MTTGNPENPHNRKGIHLGNASRNLSLLMCMGALAGILIWAKLRLVTDIPRSAYADPREQVLPDEQADPEEVPSHDEGQEQVSP